MFSMAASDNLTGMGFAAMPVTYTFFFRKQFFSCPTVYVLYTIGTMKTRPIPIRLKTEDIRLLDIVACRLGICRSAVIKLAVALQLQEIQTGNINVTKGQA